MVFKNRLVFQSKTIYMFKVRTLSLEVQIARNRSKIRKKVAEGESGKQEEVKASKRDARASQEQPRSGPLAPTDI